MTKKYCLGFVFNDEESRVLLLRKEKPEWQKGFLNGIGGHVEEGETFYDAMIREGIEEAKLDVTWQLFATTGSADWAMQCFRATSSTAIDNAPAENDVGEKLIDLPLFDFHGLKTIPNLKWLVPMALAPEHFWPFSFVDTLPTGTQP